MTPDTPNYSEDEMIKYEDMLKEMAATATSYDELIKIQRRWNAKNDPAKVKAIAQRRKQNKLAKKARKVNRQKKK